MIGSLIRPGLIHISRETQLMALSKHPNVLRVRGEWIDGSKLYIACRYMSPGKYTFCVGSALLTGW